MVTKTNHLSSPSTRERGLSAESLARVRLEELGYVFIEANFRWCGGEIDLVFRAQDGVLVFAEVRSSREPSPWLRYSIGMRKRVRLIRTAQTFRLKRPWARRMPFRFDLVWIEAGRFEHWKNVLIA